MSAEEQKLSKNMYINEHLEEGLFLLPIPERMKGGIRRYVYDGIPPGGFLMAIMEGNLVNAWILADTENRVILHHYAHLVYDFMPSFMMGSKEKVVDYLEKH
jgi:hypothetical protein